MAKDTKRTVYTHSQRSSFKDSGISSLYLDVETAPGAINLLSEDDRAFFLRCTIVPVSTKKEGKRLARILLFLKASVKAHNLQ